MVKVQRSYRRAQRKQQIITLLKIWKQSGYAESATSYKIAKGLGMRPQQAILRLLYEMVDEGDLHKELVQRPGRWEGYEFLLTEKHVITEKFSRRHISLKKRGVVVGQLEMFS